MNDNSAWKMPTQEKNDLPAAEMYFWLTDEHPGQISNLVPTAVHTDIYIQYSAGKEQKKNTVLCFLILFSGPDKNVANSQSAVHLM